MSAPTVRIVTPLEVWCRPAPSLSVEAFVAHINEALYAEWSDNELGSGTNPSATGRRIPVPEDLSELNLREVVAAFKAAGWAAAAEREGDKRAIRFWIPTAVQNATPEEIAACRALESP